MSRELKNATGTSFNDAFRLIRTETSHIDGAVTLEGYKQAKEELGLEYYVYDAFLDTRTSAICEELNGQRFRIDDAEVGVNYPPMHPNCRSTTQLVLDENYKQPIKELTEFKDFKQLNAKSYELAKFSENATDTKTDAIKFARKTFDKNTLNSYYNVGKLNNEQIKLLGSKSKDIKFSVDSMIKNKIEHPDLNFYKYKNITDILSNADETIKGRKNHIRLFKKIDNKFYEAVIKTTADKKENYFVSLHRVDESKLKNIKRQL